MRVGLPLILERLDGYQWCGPLLSSTTTTFTGTPTPQPTPTLQSVTDQGNSTSNVLNHTGEYISTTGYHYGALPACDAGMYMYGTNTSNANAISVYDTNGGSQTLN